MLLSLLVLWRDFGAKRGEWKVCFLPSQTADTGGIGSTQTRAPSSRDLLSGNPAATTGSGVVPMDSYATG